jgi:hypothetical protein
MRCGHAGAGGKTRPRARPGGGTRPRQRIVSTALGCPQGWKARPGGVRPPGGQRSAPGKDGPGNPADGRAKMFPPRAPWPSRRSRHQGTPGGPGKICGPPGERKREAGCGIDRAAQADKAGSRAAQAAAAAGPLAQRRRSDTGASVRPDHEQEHRGSNRSNDDACNPRQPWSATSKKGWRSRGSQPPGRRCQPCGLLVAEQPRKLGQGRVARTESPHGNIYGYETVSSGWA